MKDQHIIVCKQEIERRLNWGPSEQWTNQDFELLVEEIFNKTKANVSLTTLKRIWGKVDYQSKPSIATLNVLAQYLGYAHWRDFRKQQHGEVQKNAVSTKKNIRRFFNQKIIASLVVIMAL